MVLYTHRIKLIIVTYIHSFQHLHLYMSVHRGESGCHSPFLILGNGFKFYAVCPFQSLQVPHHLQVGLHGEVLPTEVDEILPLRADVQQIRHAVEVRLHPRPAGVDHFHGLTDHEDVGETGSDVGDGGCYGSFGFCVDMDAVHVLGHVDGSQEPLKVLDLETQGTWTWIWLGSE